MLDFSRVTCATCRRALAVSSTRGPDEAIRCPLCAVRDLQALVESDRGEIGVAQSGIVEPGIVETGIVETGMTETGRRRDRAPSRPRGRTRASRRTAWRVTIGVF
jgi:hypothetical protein